MEEWKTIPRLDNYEASSLGRLRRKSTKRIIKGSISSDGYRKSRLKGDTNVSFHRLIALTFLGDSFFEGAEVNHKNEVKTDNRVSNLEWLSHGDNVRYSTKSKYNTPIGVNYDKSRGKYLAKVKLNGKTINLGRYNTVEEALKVRNEYLQSLSVSS